MPSGPIIVFGEIRAVTSRPTPRRRSGASSPTSSRSASLTAPTGPNFLITLFPPTPIFGPAPASRGGDWTRSKSARRARCGRPWPWPPEAATIGGISENARIGLPSIARIASSVRRPAASAGWPGSTCPARTSGWTPIEPIFSAAVASERTGTSRSSDAAADAQRRAPSRGAGRCGRRLLPGGEGDAVDRRGSRPRAEARPSPPGSRCRPPPRSAGRSAKPRPAKPTMRSR